MTHVINQGMAMYWGTSRWSPMEIMVRLQKMTHGYTGQKIYLHHSLKGSLFLITEIWIYI